MVLDIRPKSMVFENVPGIVDMVTLDGVNVAACKAGLQRRTITKTKRPKSSTCRVRRGERVAAQPIENIDAIVLREEVEHLGPRRRGG